jgi:phage shock protein A
MREFAKHMSEVETQINTIQVKWRDFEARMSDIKEQMTGVKIRWATSSAASGHLNAVAGEATGTSDELGAIKAQRADLAHHLSEIDKGLVDVRNKQEQLHGTPPRQSHHMSR